ncbi:MAG: hypothetical protein QOH21_3530 [Acidobacteriota bacterium]|jgi:hypothetical protein|nr:hypothetical protein [Acidobacteriota bacterium]
MVEFIPIVGIFCSCLMVVLVVAIVSYNRSRRAQVQAEVQTKLIDRFGSAPELISFLQSPAGRSFVSGVQSAPAVYVRERIISGFSRAVVLTMLGIAFALLTFFYNDDFAIPAAIVFCLGLGYLLATWLSLRLADKLTPADPLASVRGDEFNQA